MNIPAKIDFEKLTVAERTQLFIEWVGTKKGAYNYNDVRHCPLAQFGREIVKGNEGSVVGGGWSFVDSNIREYTVFENEKIMHALRMSTYFEELNKKLKALNSTQ